MKYLKNWRNDVKTSKIHVELTKEAISIEEKMRKVTSSKEPIENVAPLIYTDRKDGVKPEFDYRSDRFEIARQAKDRVFATRAAKRDKQIMAERAAEEAAQNKSTNEQNS